jgi:hypothetical protein
MMPLWFRTNEARVHGHAPSSIAESQRNLIYDRGAMKEAL